MLSLSLDLGLDFLCLFGGSGTPYSPSLDFSIAANSQYLGLI